MELYEQITKRWPELSPRILFMTGGAVGEEERQFLGAHRGESLRKPVALDELRLAMERLGQRVAKRAT